MNTNSIHIAASLRDQMVDVSVGSIAPAEYVRRVEHAREQGVTIPEVVEAFAARCAAVTKGN